MPCSPNPPDPPRSTLIALLTAAAEFVAAGLVLGDVLVVAALMPAALVVVETTAGVECRAA